jgi:hypothetical protein
VSGKGYDALISDTNFATVLTEPATHDLDRSTNDRLWVVVHGKPPRGARIGPG